MIDEKFLPLGTVVLLKDGVHKVMIIGYCAVENSASRKIYDYVGCLFPEGLIKLDQTLLFEHKNIVKVFSLGYQNKETVQFNTKLKNFVKNNVGSDGLLKSMPTEFMKG